MEDAQHAKYSRICHPKTYHCGLRIIFSFMHWRRKRQPTPVFLLGESQGQRSLVGCHLWGRRVRHNWSDLAAAAERPTRCSRTNTKNRCPFHHRGVECKTGSPEIPGAIGKFGLVVQNEAGQKLTEFCQENTLVIASTLFQHKRQPYTRTSPDG